MNRTIRPEMTAFAAASDDIEEVAAAVETVRERRAAAEAEMLARDTLDPADWPARDRAAAEFDRLDKALGMLASRLWQLEEAEAEAEFRELRRGYWQQAI